MEKYLIMCSPWHQDRHGKNHFPQIWQMNQGMPLDIASQVPTVFLHST